MNNTPIIAKIVMVLLAVGVVVAFSEEQVLSPTFYGGQGGDYCTAIINTPDNGYLLAGYSTSFSSSKHAYILHVDSLGDTIRLNLFKGTGILNIIKVSDNKYAAIGSISSVENRADMLLLLIDSIGNVLLSRNYGGIYDDHASHIFATDDGGYILSGYIMLPDTNYGLFNGIVMKLDSIGDIQWQTTVGDSMHPEDIAAAIKTHDGGIVLLGTKNSQFWLDSAEFYLVKMNFSGEILWEKTYKGLGYARGKTIMEQINGNLVLTGQSGSVGDSHGVIYAIGVDSVGNVLWEKKYQRQNNDYGSYLYGSCQISDNQMLLTGMVRINQQSSTTQGRAIMIDSIGGILWINDYELEKLTSGLKNNRGKIIIAGNTNHVDESSNNICIFQVDSLGNADFSNIHNYVGVRKEYTPPYTINRLNNLQEIDNSVTLDFFTLTGRKISPRLEIHTGARSALRYRRSGMSIARTRNGKTTRSGKVVRVK